MHQSGYIFSQLPKGVISYILRATNKSSAFTHIIAKLSDITYCLQPVPYSAFKAYIFALVNVQYGIAIFIKLPEAEIIINIKIINSLCGLCYIIKCLSECFSALKVSSIWIAKSKAISTANSNTKHSAYSFNKLLYGVRLSKR